MRIWMFIATVLCLQTVEAQRLYSEVGDIYEKSKRTVVDNAKLGAFYKLKFRTDSTKLNDYTEAQTVLMISDHYLVITTDWPLIPSTTTWQQANEMPATTRHVMNGWRLSRSGLISLLP